MGENDINFRVQAIKDRNIDELIGICRGIIFDDHVNKKEVDNLMIWIENHFNFEDINKYPINNIYDRLKKSLEDEIIDNEESLELKELLQSFTGEKPIINEVSSMTSSLPLCKPAPNVIFIDRLFCLTGVFTIGTRKTVENIIIEFGGRIISTPSLKTNYLVVGILGSDDWIHSSFGRKIEAAVEIRDIRGKNLNIISEEHFIKFL